MLIIPTNIVLEVADSGMTFPSRVYDQQMMHTPEVTKCSLHCSFSFDKPSTDKECLLKQQKQGPKGHSTGVKWKPVLSSDRST